jgi:hypothetical protein
MIFSYGSILLVLTCRFDVHYLGRLSQRINLMPQANRIHLFALIYYASYTRTSKFKRDARTLQRRQTRAKC